MSYNIDTSKPESFLPAAATAAAAAAGNFPITYNKLQDLADHHTEIMDTLSPQVRQRVESLKEIQGQHDELEATFLEERKELEAKYQKLYEPLYTKRFEIVSGVVEVDGVTTDTSLEQDKTNEGKGVPDFWLTALKTNEIMAEEISERDEDALKYLKDIKCSRIDSPKGFKLDFLFDTNPFFKNPVLTKTYHMVDEDEPMLEKAIGTQIEWYPGKCLTQKTLKKKPKKGAKNAKTITKTENCESFFNFFSPPEVPDQDQDNIDEDEAEELQNLMEQDYDIGSTIRDKIIPYAVSWFTGEAVDDGELDMVDDTEEEEDEDDDANEKVDEEEVESTKKKSDVARAGESQQGQGQRGRGRGGLGQQGRGRGRVGEGQQGVVGLGQQGRGRVVEGQQWRRVVEAQQAGRVREGRLGQIEEGQQGGVGEGEVGQTPECKQQ